MVSLDINLGSMMGGGGLGKAIGGGSGASGLAVGGQIGMILQGLDIISGYLKKMVEKLSEISPILKGSLDIAKRSFQLVLKPFADALGTFLLPLSKLLLRLAVKWMKVFICDELKKIPVPELKMTI